MTVNIAKVQPQKRNKNRFNLYTEEGFLISLSYETLLKFHIREGGALEEEELEQVRAEDTVKYAKEQAMQYVAYAPRSQRQVEQQLAKKGVDEQSIAGAVETMKKYGYIDDAAYVQEFVRSYAKRMGAQAIRQKLMQNGVSGRVVEENLSLSDEAQLETACMILTKQAKKYQKLGPQKAKQRMYAMLARRGFSGEVIRRAMARAGESLDE